MARNRNTTKCGVDVMDQMVQEYSMRAGTQRWPVTVFYNMIDMAALNAHVLYQACTGVQERRVDFLVELARELGDLYKGFNSSPNHKITNQKNECHCHKTGHFARDCRKKQADSSRRTTQQRWCPHPLRTLHGLLDALSTLQEMCISRKSAQLIGDEDETLRTTYQATDGIKFTRTT
ncbi:hypothetical protein MHYP_G00093770 [Metynnis hypsauchen]